jgi:hypothetical protein
MNLHFPIFDVGVEIEFFLFENTKEGDIVYNASKVLKDILGFSIDQNAYAQTGHESGSLRLNDNLILKTDGTVCEAQMLFPTYHFREPKSTAFIRDEFERIKHLPLLKKYQKTCYPFLRVGDKNVLGMQAIVFDSPGNVFSSWKEMRNAYTEKSYYPDKKEKQELVSFRTAGGHLHFSFTCDYITRDDQKKLNDMFFSGYKHTDHLVKEFDKIYDVLVAPFTNKAEKERINCYAERGEYRIKRGTITGNPTLEYRFLSASLFDHYPALVLNFINACQLAAQRYVEKVINN